MTGTGSVITDRVGTTALVKLNRPDVLNAFDAGMRSALRDTLQAVGDDTSVRVVVLTGEGRLFSAGADLKAGAPTAAQAHSQLLEEYGPALTAIADMPKPVIAALDGPAVGIGLAYALICDLRVMAESAYLQAPFNDIGLLPDGGLSWLLPRMLGYGHAFEFIAESRKLDATRCLDLGLVNRIVADGHAVLEALAWAETLAQRPALALAASKQAMRSALSSTYAQALIMEAELQGPLVESQDCAEGIAAFIEKRLPKFSDG
ncbi:MAG: enoyl-CoA hydratase-related protein [Gammaproteobacteria bacterium]|nr:enoyl-CoA hydratase-related protein [Gammaproteobacteria bacterium]MDH3505691.1 enoyl-CoA hydratase-related protein [Gammaproteobacteria bacterium]